MASHARPTGEPIRAVAPLGADASPPSTRAVRILRLLRWALPLVLFLVALYSELSEHLVGDEESLSVHLLVEVVVFSVLGPVVVALTLTWVLRLVGAYQATADALRDANVDLEAKVAERTDHLRLTTEQLADANRDLEAANRELRHLDRMKSDFVALVSHQLRAPMTNIVGGLELVTADSASLPASSQRTLQILVLESQRLARLIQRILDVSRLEAGRLPLHLGPVAVEPLLARAAASTLGPAETGTWRLEVPGELPPAWADEQLLDEVVRNLLENAVRHAPGSPVTIDASVADGWLEIGVRDRGPGVALEDRERIFGWFQRVGDVDTTVVGHGLGLYFAERLMAAQHGTLDVVSPITDDPAAPGARFRLRLAVAGGGPDEDDDAPWLDPSEERG